MLEEHTVLAIAFLLQVLFGNKAQSCRVDTVPQSVRSRAVIEYMAQVGIRCLAAYLSADHQVAEVGFLLDHIVPDRTREARPAAAGIELVL